LDETLPDASGRVKFGRQRHSGHPLHRRDQGNAVAPQPETIEANAQQYLTGYYPVIFLALYDKYGMIPTSNVLTGPPFVTEETAAQVIELSEQSYC